MKQLKYLIWAFVILFILTIEPQAASSANLYFCEEAGVQRTFQILGYALFILKILIPILIMIFGMIDFSKALIANDDSAIKKSTSALVKRVLAGVIIFLIPTIVYFAFSLVNGYNPEDNKYYKCVNCMTNPSNCNPKDK